MKELFTKLFGAAILLIVVMGCATSQATQIEPAEAPAAEEKQTEQKAEEPKDKSEPAPVAVEIEETYHLVEEELSFFADGFLDERRVNSYSDDGIELLESQLFDLDGNLVEKSLYTWESGNLVQERSFNKQDELLGGKNYRYDDKGNLLEEEVVNDQEEVQTRQGWEYDSQGNQVRWNVKDAAGVILAYTLYHYEEGNLVRIENFSPGGDMEEYYLLEYDDQGREIKRTEYNQRNQVQSYISYRYESGNLVEESTHLRSGAVRRKTLYKPGDHGKPVEIMYLDQSNNLLEKITRSYISRTITRTVMQ